MRAGASRCRYHERAVERRELRKYHRVRQLAKELPRIRRTLHADARPGAPAHAIDADTAAATVLRLISETFCRVGGERYTRENGTFGITTLRKSHVELSNKTARFAYRGKANIRQRQVVHDRELVRLVSRQLRTPGTRLFRYANGRGWRLLTARDVNEYLRRRVGHYSAKDLRTWGGTLRAATVLAELGPAKSPSEAKRERGARDASRIVGARQHGDHLPEVVRPSDRDRALSRRGGDDSAAARAAAGLESRAGPFPRGACVDRVSRPPLSRASPPAARVAALSLSRHVRPEPARPRKAAQRSIFQVLVGGASAISPKSPGALPWAIGLERHPVQLSSASEAPCRATLRAPS